MEEEEIIIPEEETFDYNKLRYILTNDGYVCHASIGGFIVCDLGECTEYNGDIPDGYETIEEWYEEEIDKLNAWKIVDGNLEFDPNKYEILQAKCEKEHEDNRYVCHKEISNLTNLVKSDNAENYLTSTSILSNFIEVTDSNKFVSTYIELFANENISNKLHIKFNNGNLLTNSATSKMDSGISFEVNTDRTISIKGTATNDIEYDIGGYPNNTKPILALKKGINYYLSSNGHQIKMYNFDGTDREEIYSGNGGVINFTDGDRKVTEIVLFIPNETKVKTTLKPMLNVGDTAKEYITYEGSDAVVYLGENIFTHKDIITIEDGWVTYKTIQYPSSDLQATKGLKPSETLTPSATLEPSNEVMTTVALYPSNETYVGYTKVEYLDDVVMPNTYLDLTYMYCMENIKLKVIYPNIQKNNDLTGYETPNGGFAIDEEGNMYCNNATINGSAIVNGEKFNVDKNGNMTCNNATMNNATINNTAIVNGEKFNVDAAGNMKCNNATMNNATVTGGEITLSNTQAESTQQAYSKLKILTTNNDKMHSSMSSYYLRFDYDNYYSLSSAFGIDTYDNDYDYSTRLKPGYIFMDYGTNCECKWQSGDKSYLYMHDAYSQIDINGGNDPYYKVKLNSGSNFSSMTPNGVWAASFNNNSLESKKKNIELDNGCLEEIINSDIASFNWKYEDDEDQKHIGLIIADETGNYKVSPKVLTHDKDAIDLYSMNGMAWKGIQELYNIVIEQQKKIKELEEKLNGIIETNKTN